MTQIIPYIFYRDVEAALAFLERAFGFKREMLVETPSGGKHGEASLDGQLVMMGQGATDQKMKSAAEAGLATMGIFVWVDDADAHFEAAKAAGVDIVHPPQDMSYGRSYTARDLDGNPWFFTRPLPEG